MKEGECEAGSRYWGTRGGRQVVEMEMEVEDLAMTPGVCMGWRRGISPVQSAG